MKVKPILIGLFISCVSLYSHVLNAQQHAIGIFEHHQDVGNPKLKGSAEFDSNTGTYTAEGAGINMWASADQFHFLWKKIKGDFVIRVKIQFIGSGTDPHRKIGVMARDKLTTDSRYADACVHGDGLTSLQYRDEEGGETSEVVHPHKAPVEIMFERKGNVFTFSTIQKGVEANHVTKEIELSEEVYAGLFICSHNEDVIEKALFSDVTISNK